MIGIYGLGGFGREILPIAWANIAPSRAPDAVVFVDDSMEKICGTVHGVHVLSFDDSAAYDMVIAVADAGARRAIATKCAGRKFATLVAETHVRGPGVEVGEGGIFCAFTTVTADARIGRHFHCNIYSYVAHDCVVGDFVTLAPCVAINGNTVVEDDVYIGTGAVLRQGVPGKPLRIGRGATIGMGAVVTRDVAPGVTVIGNPARPMER